MIAMSFYINEAPGYAVHQTGLAIDEIEEIVGKFNKNSRWAGQLRGEVVIDILGNVMIRHHFTKKVLWHG